MRALKVLLLGFCAFLGLLAQGGFDPVKDVKVSFRKGEVWVSVPEVAHLKKDFMKVTLKGGSGRLEVGPLPATTGRDELGDGIWRGTVKIPVKGQGLSGKVKLEVEYQPCLEGEGGVCFPPTDQIIEVKAADIPALAAAPVAPAPETPAPEVKAPEAKAPEAAPLAAPAPVQPVPAPAAPASSGLLWALLAAFGWGLAASLTPCVYPMIPITMAIIGAKGGGRARGFLLSLSLVLGMAVTYTALGVVAGLSGSAFGAAAQKPAFLIPVSVLFAAFSLSLFGAFEIKLPDSLQAKLQGSGPRQGFGGAFIMGLVLGPLAAPCVGPFVGTVLVNIAGHQSVAAGALQLFVFALGMGVLFMAVGTFSAGLPKSGDWLTRFKLIMGLVVLGFAAWNVRLIVPEWANPVMWSLVMLVGAAVFGAFEAAEGLLGQLRRGLGLLMLVLGLLLGIRAVESGLKVELLPRGGSAAAVEEHGAWMEQDLEGARAKAKAEGKLVLVDIYAAWCAQCKELDEKTWPDPAVKAWIQKHAVAVRIDTDAKRKDLAGSLRIGSYPTVILMDGEGREVRRILGFHKPEGMMRFLEGK